MRPSDTALPPLHNLAPSPPRDAACDPVLWLRLELLRALGRARTFQRRCRAREFNLREVQACARLESRLLRGVIAELRERLLAARLEVAQARAEAQQERRLRRLQAVRLQLGGQMLESKCRALLLAIRRICGAESDVQAPYDPPPHARGSA